MAATGVASRSMLLGSIVKTVTSRNLITARGRTSIPNLNLSSLCFKTSAFRQTRIGASASRILRRELSTHQPFHTIIASACLVSKIPSDATTSFEGRFASYLSPIQCQGTWQDQWLQNWFFDSFQ